MYILSLSYGKDSLKTLDVIKETGNLLDAVITVDIWADNNTRGELPQVLDFKKYCDKEIEKRYGIKVEHIRGVSFEEQFYTILTEGDRKGSIYGFPLTGKAWCNDRLKLKPIDKYITKDDFVYIGFAYDEMERYKKLKDKTNKIFPLIDNKITEQECYDWCKQVGLLSPAYNFSHRDGCWFCPNANIGFFKELRNKEPDLWQKLLQWDEDSPIKFKYTYSVHDLDRKFLCEEKGIKFEYDIKVGDIVYVGNKIGTVVKIERGKAFIQDGSMSYCKPVSCCMKVKMR